MTAMGGWWSSWISPMPTWCDSKQRSRRTTLSRRFASCRESYMPNAIRPHKSSSPQTTLSTPSNGISTTRERTLARRTMTSTPPRRGMFGRRPAHGRNFFLEDSTESNFLAWIPEDPAGGVDMAYSVLVRFLVDSLEARVVPPGESVAAFGPARLPSAGRAALRLRLNRPGTFTVTICDVLGRRVRDLVREERFDRGEHRVAWDGRDRQGMPVAAGVYLARLQQEERAGSRPRSARLLLIR
ncbi:MAG: hypothetical protein GF355_12550 [Candidatus Eisenbacteria bacterium]|nr:hypothetical protein [Candidatus Eisenbacteria bacterium]